MPFYEKGDVRIRYEETGSGFPLLLVPGGGLNSRISNWRTAVFNSMEIFKDEFRCITMDQRNANGGESSGPIPAANPWDAFPAKRRFWFCPMKRRPTRSWFPSKSLHSARTLTSRCFRGVIRRS
jgi:pimeloyl-ACP methyl ester carboxylesterase